MQLSLSSHEIQILKKILDLASVIENQSSAEKITEHHLSEIHQLLNFFLDSQNPDLKRLTQISDHLHPDMTLKHFLNFMVPLERLIDRNVQDDEFLISTKDSSAHKAIRHELYFVLDHIRSAFNVGSIFRLADCVGVKKIFLCGYTPTPEQKGLQKTSMGAHEFIDYQVLKTEDAIDSLKKSGVFVIALETSKTSASIYQGTMKGPTAFVVGNERFGINRNILDMCDEVRHVPVYGVKNSLNVANSLSISAYEWSRQNL